MRHSGGKETVILNGGSFLGQKVHPIGFRLGISKDGIHAGTARKITRSSFTRI